MNSISEIMEHHYQKLFFMQLSFMFEVNSVPLFAIPLKCNALKQTPVEAMSGYSLKYYAQSKTYSYGIADGIMTSPSEACKLKVSVLCYYPGTSG